MYLGGNAIQYPFFHLPDIRASEQHLNNTWTTTEVCCIGTLVYKQMRRTGTRYQSWVAPSLSSFFQKWGSAPQIPSKEVMLEAIKVSVELIIGRKRDFRVSLLLLSFTLGLQNVHLSANNGRKGTAKRECKDHGEGIHRGFEVAGWTNY